MGVGIQDKQRPHPDGGSPLEGGRPESGVGRRGRRNRGKQLMRKRAKLVERSFEHVYNRGGMRRTHLRGHKNILKRLLIHVCGFNHGLLMKSLWGYVTPRGLQGRAAALLEALFVLFRNRVSNIARYSSFLYRLDFVRYQRAAVG